MLQEIDRTFGIGLFIFLAFIMVFGILGNILSLAIWSRGERCRQLQMSSYFRPLAIVDICVLVFPALELLMFLPPVEVLLRDLHDIFCKVLPFTITSSLRLSTWIIVTFTVERVLHVYLPLRFSSKPNNRRVYFTVAILAIVSYGLNIPYLLDLHVRGSEEGRTSNQSGYDTPVRDNNVTLSTVYRCGARIDSFTGQHYIEWELYFNLFTYSAIPFIVLLTSNILILIKLFKRSHVMNGTLSEQQQTKRIMQFKHATYQVMAASFIRCVTSLPSSILEILAASNIKNQEPIQFEFMTEAFYMSNVLTYLDSAINFVLYCLVGTDFRQDFIEVFRPCRL